MTRRDIEDVIALERSVGGHDWSENDVAFNMRYNNCLIVELQIKTVGFTIYELYKERLHVIGLVVKPVLQRHGIGRQVLKRLMMIANGREITICVRESNLPAQLFLKAMGFKASEVIRNFYQDSGESAYLMCLAPSQGI